STLRTASTTVAPRAASTRAVSYPRPVLEPVTIATRPDWSGTCASVHFWLMDRTYVGHALVMGAPLQMMRDPAYPPSRSAPVVWALGAAIPWLIFAFAQLIWFVLDGRWLWLHGLAALFTVVGAVISVVVAPLWRYRVHRWEI